MTNSEAINFLKGYLDEEVYTEKCRIAHKMAIKALEQKPCEDCISREDAIKQCGFGMTSLLIAGCLRGLPSVTPQQKVGQWIEKYAEDACGERYSYWACSECGRDVGFNLANIKNVLSDYPYCHCGAKMVEP